MARTGEGRAGIVSARYQDWCRRGSLYFVLGIKKCVIKGCVKPPNCAGYVICLVARKLRGMFIEQTE